MSSPILKIIFNDFHLNSNEDKPIYLQLAEVLLLSIKHGKLQTGQKLPSSRDIAVFLGINRITVSKAFEELQNQGWLEGFTGRGTFVSAHIPEIKPEKLEDKSNKAQKAAGFKIDKPQYLENSFFVPTTSLHFDDGFPDPKLAPLKELYRAYRSQLTRSGLYDKFGSYGNPDGSDYYKNAISKHLNETRGLKTTSKNILSVRGTVMGVNLVCNALVQPSDIIVSGIPGWRRAENNFLHAKAKHIGIPVDENGLVIEELKKICQKNKVRMVYITPHHHYPTTVALRIDRRLELLELANEYGFIIFEDDYDFDFHYSNRPLLPLASADENGMVIYCGSFSKSFSPAFRMGYLAASENVIEHLTKVRVLLDRQGDHILDNAMAEIINDGTVQRYLRKSLTIYEDKRNHFCNLLNSELRNAVYFSIPQGGMTVWTKFDKSINVEQLAKEAYKKGLYFSDGKAHQYPNYNENGTRLGFASSSKEELEKGVEILKRLI
ncbi:PLP-dependent aminotransferase family protein [Flavobacterium sp. UBA4854]|uniref:aminotransferase-like domain-containing protein n=1 Tax=Flavobacterium sp. UBA4854 TaxID=1946548 RepID=UPI00257F6AAC|nr:PLP-dependent aminotransferase family protein [Flavobacterium sp. UBA4854]